MTWLENVVLSVVEGLTEYLPVSSTGHLMMTKEWLHVYDPNGHLKTYMVAIQFGAILAVVAIYWKRFFSPNWFSFYQKLLAAFIPTAILGKLFDDFLEKLLETPMVVAVMLIVVGAFLLVIDKLLPEGDKEIEHLSLKQSFFIGIIQSFAMIPGTSRSAATIAGGLGMKLSRKAAAEFSFFLAVPTLSAAGIYQMYKHWNELSSSSLQDIAVGNILSFVTAFFAVKFFIELVQKQGFKFFGIYRIIIGTIFLITLL